MPQLGPFQKRIGYAFRNQGLMVLALTHPSVGHEKDKAESNNQRLEFLGDAVLQLVISTALYKQFSQHDEGTLSKVRARLVNREELASRARDIKLGAQLNVSRGEEKNGGRNRDSALADAFEALIGAIYLDGGFSKVEIFIHTQFADALAGADAGRHVGNPKGELQELFIGEDNYCLVKIPPGITNGYKAYGDKMTILANCATEPHSKEEMIYIDPFDNDIPYKWNLKHG